MRLMKSRAAIGALTVAIAVSLAAPAATAAPAPNHVREMAWGNTSKEVLAYAKAMQALAPQEASLLARYGAVTGANYTTDKRMYTALVKLIPDLQKFIGKVEAVKTYNAKIAAVHEIYISAWNLQIEGMTMAMSALEQGSYATMAKANAKLSAGRAKMRQYILKVKALA